VYTNIYCKMCCLRRDWRYQRG